MEQKRDSLEIISELEERLVGGGHVNTTEIAHEFFDTSSHEELQTAKNRAHYYLARARESLADEGYAVSRIAPGYWGIPKTKEEYQYSHNYQSRRVRREIDDFTVLYSFGDKRGLLPEGVQMKRLEIPSFTI